MSTLSALSQRVLPSERVHAKILDRVRRRGAGSPPYALAYRQVFILPTVFGTGFGALLALMALGGLNFNNNMALLLVFLLGALAVSTNLLAYRNLAGLGLDAVRADPVFAGDEAHVRLFLTNPEDRVRPALQAAVGTQAAADCIDLPARSGGSLRVRFRTERRGWAEVPPLRLETRHPLGLFRAWSWIFAGARCLVYPRPAKNPPPLPRGGQGHSGHARRGEGDQVHGLRGYRHGDSMHRVAWKTSARHDTLLTREMETPRDDACVLSWHRLAGMDEETRLSVLTSWVLQADHRQLSYTLEMPDRPPLSGSGESQRAGCLEALALFGS